jgi:flagellar biogenesis protein FliO
VAPPVTVTALLVVLALVPGWVYLRLVERLGPRSSDSPLHQLLEVLAVGAATTGVSAFVVAVLPHRWLPFTLDIGAWATGGPDYLRVHWRSAAGSVAMIFILATILAVVFYGVRAWSKPPEFESHNNWVQSLGNRPAGTAVWVGLHLEDGRGVEGVLHSYSLDEDPAKRDVTLAKPIRITEKGAVEVQYLLNLDRLMVPASKITFIGVVHSRGQPTVAGRRRRRWYWPFGHR